MRLYTIGFTKKTAHRFFDLLKTSGGAGRRVVAGSKLDSEGECRT